VEKIKDKDNIDLIISGHTHGGQIFPFGFLVLIDQPYLYGLYQHSSKTQVFVSSGVGYWGPPLRILAPSEVVKLELKG
jgi:predicted MPP superfamily phosphohydrolase